jgi:hypothetical protein
MNANNIEVTIATHSDEELALGYLRYERVRRMHPAAFAELYRLNLEGKGAFDELVDKDIRSEVDKP